MDLTHPIKGGPLAARWHALQRELVDLHDLRVRPGDGDFAAIERRVVDELRAIEHELAELTGTDGHAEQ
ncbi:MAG TPA: hypothetical protein VK324_12605 [Tepidisphaeraceae bacterium]|nr:hypothetical protein [Tepidisphaeraceae bacterium]